MTHIRSTRILGTVIIAILISPFEGLLSPAAAQGWSWPENPENLKVLGDTTSPETLSRTMRGFASSLGVRCHHCHVGEPGAPLSEYDFPSDDKRTKRVAREMLRMVRMINAEVIAEIEEPSGKQVTCFTCHRGQETPPPPLHTRLLEIEAEEGIEAAMAEYDQLHEVHFGTGVYDFGPRTFTKLADGLLEKEKAEAAVTALERGMKEHPDDYLIRFYASRAYLTVEDTTLGRIHLEKAVALNPKAGWLRGQLNALSAH